MSKRTIDLEDDEAAFMVCKLDGEYKFALNIHEQYRDESDEMCLNRPALAAAPPAIGTIATIFALFGNPRYRAIAAMAVSMMRGLDERMMAVQVEADLGEILDNAPPAGNPKGQ